MRNKVEVEKNINLDELIYSYNAKAVLYFLWPVAVVHYKRIEPGKDSIVIEADKYGFTVKYKDYQNFDWTFKSGGTLNDVIIRNKASIHKYEKGSVRVCKNNRNKKSIYVTGVKELIGKDVYSDSFLHSNDVARRVFPYGQGIRKILFEVLLNLCQHEYRNHCNQYVDVVLNSLLDSGKFGDSKSFITLPSMKGHILIHNRLSKTDFTRIRKILNIGHVNVVCYTYKYDKNQIQELKKICTAEFEEVRF